MFLGNLLSGIVIIKAVGSVAINVLHPSILQSYSTTIMSAVYNSCNVNYTTRFHKDHSPGIIMIMIQFSSLTQGTKLVHLVRSNVHR